MPPCAAPDVEDSASDLGEYLALCGPTPGERKQEVHCRHRRADGAVVPLQLCVARGAGDAITELLAERVLEVGENPRRIHLLKVHSLEQLNIAVDSMGGSLA